MVIEIAQSAPSMSSAVGYNENKVSQGSAKVIFSQGIADIKHPMATFQKYENANIRTEKLSFHASVNPSAKEQITMTPQRVIDFAREYMQEMGYGNQPYIIYQHNDIDRQHYHIVSIKTDMSGKRAVKDWKDQDRTIKIMEKLGPKYEFTVGNGERKEMKKEWTPKDSFIIRREDIPRVQPFQPKAGNLYKQVEAIVNQAMIYKFGSVRQLERILYDYGLKLDTKPTADGTKHLTFRGVDQRTGRFTSKTIDGDKINIPSFNQIKQHTWPSSYRITRGETQRVANLVNHCLPHSQSERHLQNMLLKNSVSVCVDRKDTGEIKDIILVDHANRACFSVADPDNSHFFSLRAFEQADTAVWASGAQVPAQVHADSYGFAHTTSDEQQQDPSKDNHLSDYEIEMAIDAVFSLFHERSRRNEDEMYMRKGRHK